MFVVIDTETTGLTRLSYANRINYKQWPRMVQVAWLLGNDEGIVERGVSVIDPVDFEIPLKSVQVHGISQSDAKRRGEPIQTVLRQLNETFRQAQTLVAHHLNFDLGVIQSEALRNNMELAIPEKRICTIHLARQRLHRTCNPAPRYAYRLSALYEQFFGFSYGPQHHADSDALACYHIYRKLK